ncbi:MAG: 4Fe-4S binding protein [Firmicutes bacterium]|nr:4Fe-4S binding protein [Bacillota bacterium]
MPAGAGVATSGYPSLDEVRGSPGYPSRERMAKGAVAVIECVQEIPCNPCEAACPRGAVKVGQPITNLPALDGEKCIGCGLCLARCPGLAIFLLDMTYSDTEAALSFPHEYLPLPEPGATVTAVDRAGQPVCRAKVLKVANPARNDRTPVITIAIPKEFAESVRGIARKSGGGDVGR